MIVELPQEKAHLLPINATVAAAAICAPEARWNIHVRMLQSGERCLGCPRVFTCVFTGLPATGAVAKPSGCRGCRRDCHYRQNPVRSSLDGNPQILRPPRTQTEGRCVIASGLPTNRELIELPIRPACAGSERIRLQVNLPDRLPVGLRCSPCSPLGDTTGQSALQASGAATQPPIVRLSRKISPIRLPFIKAARKSPTAMAAAKASRPITRLVRPTRNNSRRRCLYAIARCLKYS